MCATGRKRAELRGAQVCGRPLARGRLLRNGQEVEKSQAQLDYAPAHAHRTVGLYFTHDPRELQLELVPEGYREP